MAFFSGKAWDGKSKWLFYTFVLDILITQNKNIFPKICTFGCQNCFVWPILLLFAPKTAFFDKNLCFCGKAWKLKMVVLNIFMIL
jgi:hypothetical protein